MFVRVKPAGQYRYLQIAENFREGKKVKQKILCTLGRFDELTESGTLDSLAESLLRFSEKLTVLGLHRQGALQAARDLSIGPALVCERLWRELGIAEAIRTVAADRRFGFEVERAIFLTVLHRLMDPGSDRAAEKWKQDFRIEGIEVLELHQLYRAMGWLGEEVVTLPSSRGTPAVGMRTTKDRIEELLFARRRDLCSSLSVVFFDTTSIYFEGEGGESLGAFGHRRDHRPDRKQMVVGAALDERGHPVACQLLPANATDVALFFPAIKALQARFEAGSFCVVADRGMISRRTVEALEAPGSGIEYILGARMRRQKEVQDEVLGAEGAAVHQVRFARKGSSTPLAIEIKEARIEGRRYVVCFNGEQAKKGAADRQAIVESLREKLATGDEKALSGNTGYRKYPKREGEQAAFRLDEAKLEAEARVEISSPRGERYFLRTELRGCCREVLKAVGVAVPPTLRR